MHVSHNEKHFQRTCSFKLSMAPESRVSQKAEVTVPSVLIREKLVHCDMASRDIRYKCVNSSVLN